MIICEATYMSHSLRKRDLDETKSMYFSVGVERSVHRRLIRDNSERYTRFIHFSISIVTVEISIHRTDSKLCIRKSSVPRGSVPNKPERI